MHEFYHLAQHVFNVPLAILPEKSEIIVAALAQRLNIANFTNGNVTHIHMKKGRYAADEYEPDDHLSADNNNKSGYDIVNGIAVIQVYGTLVQKSRALRPRSGMTGYDGIRQNLLAAMDDPKVGAIVFDIDSPGGEVAGCFDLCDTIYELREAKQKPMVSILNEHAYSAAYAIASASSRITVPETGGAGSIGVIAMHVEYSDALKDAGISVTVIRHGERKAEGNSVEPLSSRAHKKMQGDIDAMGDIFINRVARNRNLPPKFVKDMQAQCFLAKDALDNGLVDDILAPRIEFSNLVDTIT